MVGVSETVWSSHSFFPTHLKLFLAAVLIFVLLRKISLGILEISQRERGAFPQLLLKELVEKNKSWKLAMMGQINSHFRIWLGKSTVFKGCDKTVYIKLLLFLLHMISSYKKTYHTSKTRALSLCKWDQLLVMALWANSQCIFGGI